MHGARPVTTRLFGVDNALPLDGVKLVGRTFVSLTGYRAQGTGLRQHPDLLMAAPRLLA